ncbi:MAG: protein translocase subunit SecD, partial [Phycisphaerales bacterium]|nr:protein translocase subunit SecD [Phycisphaerales bacterium]
AIRLAQRTEPETDRGLPTFYAFDEDDRVAAGPTVDRQTLLESFPADRLPEGVRVERVPRGLFLAYEENAPLQPRDTGTGRTWYVFQNRPGLTGQDITEARSQLDTRAIGGTEPIVTMQFTGDGRRKFADITRDLAVRGFNRGELQRFAIILDGQIVSNPTVDYREYPTGIDGRNGAQIQGNFTTGEAETLADQINSGALPIKLEVISQKQVSATLGKESLNQGLIAGVAGLGLVLLFLAGYYRFLGIVAGLGLVIYAILFYAVIVLVPITLTLPGIAGIILTIGVASDANVVIFERVREEARAGRSAKAAILNGYRKGISAIIDANVVTIATAIILFLFATAGVKGFAFTLFIGVLLSLFTAVMATRAMFEVLADTRFLRDDRWMGLNQRQPRWKMDWVGKWKLWMAISFIPVAMGIAYLGFFGLNLGLDFESGTRIATAFERPATETQVRQVVTDAGYPDAKIQATTEVVNDRTVEGFQIQTQALQPAEQRQLQRALDAEFGIDEQTLQLELVGPTFGEQIIRNAIYAIVLSFIVIAIYLSVRFEYKLALPAMLSVVQDVLLTIGIYSVTGREVTSATVAALLTILGYSLYDVVIVFDRIRENVPKMRKATYREVVNTSIHEVLTRSIITGFTTLLPILALYFFGGETLKDFAFALLVGILSGGTSSILISAPLAALWKEREPEDRRRRTREEKRRAKVLADADVVDLDALARAEMALEAEIAADEEGERREDDGERRALP